MGCCSSSVAKNVADAKSGDPSKKLSVVDELKLPDGDGGYSFLTREDKKIYVSQELVGNKRSKRYEAGGLRYLQEGPSHYLLPKGGRRLKINKDDLPMVEALVDRSAVRLLGLPPKAGHVPKKGEKKIRKPKEKQAKRSKASDREVARVIDWSGADPEKWSFLDVKYNGSYGCHVTPDFEEVNGPISEGVATLKAKPELYDGLLYQTNMVQWPEDQQSYRFVKRTGSGFCVRGESGDAFTFVEPKYHVLAPDVEIQKDEVSDGFVFRGSPCHEPLCPGRGVGIADVPNLKLFGEIDPMDVCQGSIGDCWLLSAISAVAEYHGAIEYLFRKTKRIGELPADESNTYTISLWDLKTWKEVDIKVDERLTTKPDGKGLLGCCPSREGELWTCYLEKAIAVHCGGYDAIDGGTCVHAFRLLLGCQDVYTFRDDDDGEGWNCYGAYNPNEERWEELANSPRETFRGLWPMPWPIVGGGGDLDMKLDSHSFFHRICAWEDESYIICCASKDGSDDKDTDGIVDGHAYTILSAVEDVAGTGINMIRVRNPWGRGEFTSGRFNDTGPGWEEFPQIKEQLKPRLVEDGIFWLEEEEFFKYFKVVYLCALNMAELEADLEADPQSAGRRGQRVRKPKEKRAKRSKGSDRAEERLVDFSEADPEKWIYEETPYGGSYSYHSKPVFEEVSAPISEGLNTLKADPAKYDGIMYQSNMVEWPEDQQQFKLILRTGSGFTVKGDSGDAFTFVDAKYQVLPPEVEIDSDGFTDSVQYRGNDVSTTICPGRGSGIADVPTLKMIGCADPSDISQGGIGDCWLLSAISAVAEYDGVIQHLFRNTPDLGDLPRDSANKYVITLWDVSTWEEVNVEVDERLPLKANGKGLLGAHPSVEGELWVCYLEKAIAAHCGGYDQIDGGSSTHAFRLLLGCKDVYTFRNYGDGWGCYGAYNPNEDKWEELANSPKQGFRSLWPMAWPEVGGGGDLDLRMESHEFFDRLCAWEDEDYIMCCGTKNGSDTEDTDGIVDGHAYTILGALHDVAGTGISMVKVRNPWGKGEFQSGRFDDDGPGWEEFPEIKEICQPKGINDGVFWLEEHEFFDYFTSVYLCAKNMSEALG